jgi:hypothetical protein
MATMFPPSFPSAPNPNDPEFSVYQILKTLPDHYTVFYSKKFKGTGSWKEEGEVDFVIFDGSKTLLCMEVKGGRIAFDGVEDVWLQNDKVLSPQPDRQATEGMRALFSFLERDVSQLNCGWILGFPHCSLPDHFQPPSRIPKAVIVDQAGFTNIEAAIHKAEQYYIDHYKKPGINPLIAKTITGRLTRSVEFINKVGVRVARDSQQLIQVTEEQYRVLEDLEINPKIAVRGFAGTGKTILATEFAKRLAARGHRTLLLFFNRTIANTVRRSFDRESPVDCKTFFGFAREMIGEQDPGWWEMNSKRSDDEFWEVDVPIKLFDLPTDEFEKYDAIIVDEGQDFRSDWYEYLESLLRQSGERRFVVFYDELQDLFGRWQELPWGSEYIARKQLTENCRNTRSIITYLNQHNPTEMIPFASSPQGEAVCERRVKSPDDAKELLIGDVGTILKQGINPGQIIVLLNEPKRESCLANVKAFGKIKFESLGRYYDNSSKSIRFTTINVFKGMEADVVFLVFDNKMNSENLSELFYVQASRARLMLFVYLL